MAKKNKSYTSLWMLLATALLSGGWLMKPVPVLTFGALAPLIAISAQAKPGLFWEKLEYILVAFVFSLWAAHLFALDFVVPAIGQAIVYTLVFGAVAIARPTLGSTASAFVLLAIWLGVEFLLLKLGLAGHALFLADAFAAHPAWTGWTTHTGYLAISAWVLVANLMLYRAFWGETPLQAGWLIAAAVVIIVPIGYSLVVDVTSVTRDQMMTLSRGGEVPSNAVYARNGEVVARTCSWIAVLIILFAFVKRHISRK